MLYQLYSLIAQEYDVVLGKRRKMGDWIIKKELGDERNTEQKEQISVRRTAHHLYLLIAQECDIVYGKRRKLEN